MTADHPGYPTNPRRVGAPLPPGMRTLPPVRLPDIEAELTRAQVELMYALAEHRKAWTRVRLLHTKITDEGGWPDSDSVFKKATGDVTWWRGEISAQADAVQALLAMRAARQPGGLQGG